MSRMNLLNFQYNVSKKLLLKPVKWLSAKDRQISGLMQTFQPNMGEMKQVFDKIDSDKDGKISRDELRWLLKALGVENIEAKIKRMMWVADLDGDGFINFREFMDVHKRGVSASDIRAAFQIFDLNGDGRIGAEEVLKVMGKLGEDCSLEACRRMVGRVDKSGDGLVDMDDFMAMMTCTMNAI